MDELNPFEYRSGSGVLQQLPAAWKLGGLALLSIIAMAGGLVGLIAASLTVTALSIAGRLAFRDLAAGSRPLLLITVSIVLIKALEIKPASTKFFFINHSIEFNLVMLAEGGLFAWGLAVTYLASAIFFLSTTSLQLRKALESGRKAALMYLLRPLTKAPLLRRSRSFQKAAAKLAAWDGALLVALVLSFLPSIFAIRAELEEAWRVRGGRGSLRAWRWLLPKLLERLFELTAEKAWALESRAYGSQPLLDLE